MIPGRSKRGKISDDRVTHRRPAGTGLCTAKQMSKEELADILDRTDGDSRVSPL